MRKGWKKVAISPQQHQALLRYKEETGKLLTDIVAEALRLFLAAGVEPETEDWVAREAGGAPILHFANGAPFDLLVLGRAPRLVRIVAAGADRDRVAKTLRRYVVPELMIELWVRSSAGVAKYLLGPAQWLRYDIEEG